MADIKYAQKYHEKELEALATLLMIPLCIPNKENLPIYFPAKASNLHRWAAFGMLIELIEAEEGSFVWTNTSLSKETFDEFNTEAVCRGASMISQKKLKRTFEPKSKGIPDFLDISLDRENEEMDESLIEELRKIMENPVYTATNTKYKLNEEILFTKNDLGSQTEGTRTEGLTLPNTLSPVTTQLKPVRQTDENLTGYLRELMENVISNAANSKYRPTEDTSSKKHDLRSQSEKVGSEDVTLSNPVSEEITGKEGTAQRKPVKIKMVRKIKYPCSTCGQDVKKNSILCTNCGLWVHNDCSGVEIGVTRLDERQITEYQCQKCRKPFQEVEAPAEDVNRNEQSEERFEEKKSQETEETDNYETAQDTYPEMPGNMNLGETSDPVIIRPYDHSNETRAAHTADTFPRIFSPQ